MRLIFFFILISPFFLSGILIDEKLSQAIHFNSHEENLVGYISIEKDRPIDQTTFVFVQFALKDFVRKKVRCIILHLDTPGGEVFAAQKIATLLQEVDTQEKIPVIAYIDKWAISAGAMLAYSCRFIAINQGSSMGAAQPVVLSEGTMREAGEKMTSALRSEFYNLALFYHRNPLLAEAMVDKDLILVERDQTVVSLKGEEEIRQSDILISNKGKLLTLNSEQLAHYKVGDIFFTSQPVLAISSAEKEKGSWPLKKTIFVTDSFFRQYSEAKMITYQDWKITLFSFLSHPAVMSILLGLMLVCFYIEFHTPGFGVMGSLGIFALSLILLSSFVVYTVHWLEVMILLIGLLLLAIELWIIPGFGLIGVLGGGLTLAGLILVMLPHIGAWEIPYHPLTLKSMHLFSIFGWILVTIVISLIMMWLLSRYGMKKLHIYRRLISQKEQEGYKAGPTVFPSKGETGIAITPLMPSGKIEIQGAIFHATTQIGFIDKGKTIIIVAVIGNKIIVSEL
ncbi:MAG: hypothetical protein JW769_03310 [Parachlamydiales bacterium]|nr:hypothetical protein [Parachlamydiales bacterium]